MAQWSGWHEDVVEFSCLYSDSSDNENGSSNNYRAQSCGLNVVCACMACASNTELKLNSIQLGSAFGFPNADYLCFLQLANCHANSSSSSRCCYLLGIEH